eukprot:207144-Chlamydomonas_euryale.AAC.4
MSSSRDAMDVRTVSLSNLPVQVACVCMRACELRENGRSETPASPAAAAQSRECGPSEFLLGRGPTSACGVRAPGVPQCRSSIRRWQACRSAPADPPRARRDEFGFQQHMQRCSADGSRAAASLRIFRQRASAAACAVPAAATRQRSPAVPRRTRGRRTATSEGWRPRIES